MVRDGHAPGAKSAAVRDKSFDDFRVLPVPLHGISIVADACLPCVTVFGERRCVPHRAIAERLRDPSRR